MLRKLQREEAMVRELPVAQLTALMANVNRDPKKSKEFKTADFCFFREEKGEGETGAFWPEVAAVALELRHQQQAPELLLAVWPEVLKAAKAEAKVPKVRALRDDSGHVWVLAPRWEGRNVRAGLVLVRGQICGSVRLRDVDRPLMAYDVKLPQRSGYGWIEAAALLAAS